MNFFKFIRRRWKFSHFTVVLSFVRSRFLHFCSPADLLGESGQRKTFSMFCLLTERGMKARQVEKDRKGMRLEYCWVSVVCSSVKKGVKRWGLYERMSRLSFLAVSQKPLCGRPHDFRPKYRGPDLLILRVSFRARGHSAFLFISMWFCVFMYTYPFVSKCTYERQ